MKPLDPADDQTCSIGTLAPGAVDTSCSFTRTVVEGDPATLTNVAVATGTSTGGQHRTAGRHRRLTRAHAHSSPV